MRVILWGILMLAAVVSQAMQCLGWMALAGIAIQASIDPRALLADFDDDWDGEWQRERLDSLEYCIESYREYPSAADWHSRVPIDRQVSRDAGGLSVQHLDEVYRAHPDDLAAATAVSVCIGDGYASDDAVPLCRLFGELLTSRYERVRYRASQSVIQRVFDDALPEESAPALLALVNRALQTERGALNVESLDYAQQLLEHVLTPSDDDAPPADGLPVQEPPDAAPAEDQAPGDRVTALDGFTSTSCGAWR